MLTSHGSLPVEAGQEAGEGPRVGQESGPLPLPRHACSARPKQGLRQNPQSLGGLHLLAYVEDADQMAGFMCHVGGSLSRKIGRLRAGKARCGVSWHQVTLYRSV